MGINFFVSFIIALFIVLISHLTVDKTFPENVKIVTWVVFAILVFLYIVFGIVLNW